MENFDRLALYGQGRREEIMRRVGEKNFPLLIPLAPLPDCHSPARFKILLDYSYIKCYNYLSLVKSWEMRIYFEKEKKHVQKLFD